jgi:hypothetical protein
MELQHCRAEEGVRVSRKKKKGGRKVTLQKEKHATPGRERKRIYIYIYIYIYTLDRQV